MELCHPTPPQLDPVKVDLVLDVGPSSTRDLVLDLARCM